LEEVIQPFTGTKAVCTVITADYLHYALALNESLLAQAKEPFTLYVLDVNNQVAAAKLPDLMPSNIVIVLLDDLRKQSAMAERLWHTYAKEARGMLRWALKSVLMQWVLKRHDFCLYCDNDLYFYQDYGFLWDELAGSSVLLSPHWRTIEPTVSDPVIKRHIELTYMHGLYNAGFVGVNRKGLDFLQWWSRCCLAYKELRTHQGLYVDQTFLNVVPLHFESVKILDHRGCNISAWNHHVCQRSLGVSGDVVINERFPLVFAHFAWGYDQTFARGEDLLMLPLWEAWQERLRFWKYYSEPFEEFVKISFFKRASLAFSWRFFKGYDRCLSVLGLQRKPS
jgi:hypothetical protein